MQTPSNDREINWEKLLESLDDKDIPAGLTREELAELAAAREIRARMAARRYDANQGWSGFITASEKHRPASFRLIKLAIAAILVVAAGVGIWMMVPEKQVPQIANAAPSGKVQLRMADGRTVELGRDSQLIQNNTVARIQASAALLEYADGTGEAAVPAMDTLDIPRGLFFSLRLSDGTKVWLNAGSRLVYPAAFHATTREVTLEGEAFFEVAHDAAKPFIVHARHTAMKVLGTGFNVNAYSPSVTTTLNNGKLLVKAGESVVTLLPDEQAVYTAASQTLTKQLVDASLFSAWKDGDIYFDEASLEEITESLSRTYDYQFVFRDQELKHIGFTLDIRRPAILQDVLDQLVRSKAEIVFQVEGKTVTISKRIESK